ncbi:hypothetical protein B5E41_30720 [Rhizobium esperanzae]|uniref:Secreted protein n=1 Tax=Rhizobium esperanzae TaxID=1967781 RepID=A0A246DKK3_9HYPH|nr:hypothetical protein [Rhizobium esperanzae]OWO89156.1 hypothetical protein B5E41_30720 [Rhizobium esperanzae]
MSRLNLLRLLLASCLATIWPPVLMAQDVPPIIVAPPSQALTDMASDEEKARKLILAETAYRLAKSGNSTIAYAALNLPRAKTPEEVRKIMVDAKDGLDEVVGRDAFVSLVKLGPVNPTYVDAINDFTKNVEAMNGNDLRLSDVPIEAALTALVGAYEQLPADVRNEGISKLAELQGKNFDDYVTKVRENRVMTGDATPKDEGGIDREVSKDGIALMTAKLREVREQVEKSGAAQTSAQEKRDREAALGHDEERLRAGVFLTSTILGQIVGPEAAMKVQVTGNSFLKMYDTMQKFGPGGLSPDKLLMCTNMVSAGLMIAQLFSNQQDPTMVALMQIMQQLKEIQAKLDVIDKKIDRLTNITLEGFDKVIRNERYSQQLIKDFSGVVMADITDDTQRAAMQAYLRFLEGDAETYKMFLQCDSTLQALPRDEKQCIEGLALDLAGSRIFTTDPTKTTPRILGPTWVNYLLSLGAPDGDGQKLALSQLSAPFFFLQLPQVSRTEIARDHEAIASAAQSYFGMKHPKTVPNPEILQTRIQVLLAASQNMPTISSREVLPLTDEALSRILEVETFLESTIGDSVALDTAWVKLAERADQIEEAVKTDINQVFSDNFTVLRTQFSQPTATKCADVGDPRNPVAFPANLDSLIPPVYWVAQELGLGQPKMCIEYLKQTEAHQHPQATDLRYYTFSYRVKIYFQFSDTGYEDTVRILNLSGTAPDPNSRTMLISSRTITSNASYTTYNTDTWVMVLRAWNGSNDYLSEVWECIDNGCNGHNPDPVFLRFYKDSVEELDAATIQAADTRIRTSVNTILKNIAVSSAKIWDPLTLREAQPQTRDKLLRFNIVTGNAISSKVKDFMLLSLSAQDLMLVGLYHGQTVSKCLQTLQDSKPEKIIEHAVDNAFAEGPVRFGDDMLRELRSTTCTSNKMSDDLQASKRRLVDLRARQLGSR